MVDEALRNWIMDQYAAGFTPEQLREKLVQSGQDPRIVDEVLGFLQKTPTPATPLPPISAQQKKKGINWTIVLAIVIIGLFLAALVGFNRIVGSLLTAVPT